MTYKKYLLNLCNDRGITKTQLAKKLGVTLTHVVNAGGTKGIAYNDLNKIIKLLDLGNEEATKLRRLAKYSTPRGIIVVDDNFEESVVSQTKKVDLKHVIAASLKFAGVKTKIKGVSCFYTAILE